MADPDLAARFPKMKPIRTSPALFRINGCGVGLYGGRDTDRETGTYVATWCLSLVFLPVLCLKAYRVAKAPGGGWYFIGSEPLSRFAKGWNVFLLLAIIGTVCGVQYSAHTSSPGYKAAQQMKAAQQQTAGGHPGEAAKIYLRLITSDTPEAANATSALKDLMSSAKQSPLAEAIDVYRAAFQISRRGPSIPPADVAASGLALATEKGEADPANAVGVLDIVRPLLVDTRPLDDRRLALLKKWAAKDPSNLAAVVPLASALEQAGNLVEAKKLLLPIRSRLGEGEGARALGLILARENDLDGAYALLWPYVKGRLELLHAAEQTLDSVAEEISTRAISELKQDKGPREFYKEYGGATEDGKRAILRKFVQGRMKEDPRYTSAQEAMEQNTSVVPVALELGIVMLQRAQGLKDPAAREKELKSTEEVFLAISGVAGETDVYRLTLGQVYYWLGKQAEGKKLFDEYLVSKGRAFKDLVGLAMKLRELGAVPEARVLAEEAYQSAPTQQDKFDVASFRKVCMKDLDDEIDWLSKCDPAEPRIKALLAKANGDKAMSQGRDSEAATYLRNAIDGFAALPRTPSSVNDLALAYSSLYSATGDRQALDKCVDHFQQAIDMMPGDPILLYNAGTSLLSASMGDIVGSALDLRALNEQGSIQILGMLFSDDASRAAVVKQVLAHPGVAKAASFLDKVTILTPKNPHAFQVLQQLHTFTRNEPALKALDQRARSADIDFSDALSRKKEYLAHTKDAQTLESIQSACKRIDAVAARVVSKGGATAAHALCEQCTGLLSLSLFAKADLDKAVQLAEQARTIHPCSTTSGLAATAHVHRALRDLRVSDPVVKKLADQYERSLSPTQILALAAVDPDGSPKSIVNNADLKAYVTISKAQAANFATSASASDWALFKFADAREADRIANVLRSTSRLQTESALDLLLSPQSASDTLDYYWMMQILGRPEEGRKAVQGIVSQGLAMPNMP